MESNAARRIKSRHLATFVEATRSGSLKSAAARLHLSQPAVSKSLKDLEDILGVPLLNRGRGGLDLTREGAVFLPFAEQSLAALGHGLASLNAIGTGSTAPLRIGALPSVAADLLPRAVDRFAALSPKTPITVEDGRIAPLLEQLRQGGLDFVIGRMGQTDTMQGLSFTQLYSERVVFAVAQGHPLAAACTLADLTDWLILYPPASAAIRPLADRFMIAHGVTDLRNRMETVSGAFGRAMTLGPRRAVWMISEGVVTQDVEAGRIEALDLDTTSMSGPIGIMARSDEDPTPPMRLFRQALTDARDTMPRFAPAPS